MSKPAKVHTVATLLANATEEGSCLLWDGSMSSQGVPHIYAKGHGMVPVRKLLTQLLDDDNGNPYYGNTCGNPRCVAPEHLMQRNQWAQSKLMAKQAHTVNKAAHVTAVIAWRRANPLKLDMERARQIRNDPRTPDEVAAEYGIHRSLVLRIRKGTAWRDTSNPFAGLLSSTNTRAHSGSSRSSRAVA